MIVAISFAVVSVLVAAGFALERAIATRRVVAKPSNHFDGTQFFNPDVTHRMETDRTGRKSVWLWMLTKRAGHWETRHVQPTLPPRGVDRGIRVTFVNHATVLIQIPGLNILTDPVWAYRASPFSFVGPARYADPGVRFEDLPPIDIVLLSHNHYDHMDIETLKRIERAWKPKIFVPLGNAAYLMRKGIHGAIDMDWWDTQQVHGVVVVCAPARHFSARTFSDRNFTLWCGFILETGVGNIYFAGDTGFGTFLKEIEERYDGFKLALLPIGAYEPAWMMHLVHVDPSEALRMHERLRVETSVAIHHGTFRLTDEAQTAPREWIERDRGSNDFRVLENGGVTEIEP